MDTKHLIWIGAGGATLPFFEFSDFDLVTLVEARASALELLRQKFKEHGHVNFEHLVISECSGVETFYSLRPEVFSQTGDISSVQGLFPNIAVTNKTDSATTSLESLLEKVCTDNEMLTLVLDVPSKNENLVEQVVAQSAKYIIEGLYVLSEKEELLTGAANGFKLVGRLEGDICGNYLHYFRDPELQSLEARLAELQKSSKERVRNLEQEIKTIRNQMYSSLAANTSLQEKEFSSLAEKLNAISNTLESGYLQHIQSTLSDLVDKFEVKLAESSALLNENIQELKLYSQNGFEKVSTSITSQVSRVDELVDQLPAIQENLKGDLVAEFNRTKESFSLLSEERLFDEKLDLLTSKVEELSVQQQLLSDKTNNEEVERVIRNIPFLLQKNSYNTSKQIESFIALNKYINHHEIPLNFHGWPISPDIGLTLIDYIENKSVDLVLEFGSGTSSVLFAKAFQLANTEQKDWCLERPIISFEHNEEYLEKTSLLLKSHKCREIVNLVHAPLVDFDYSEQQKFLYYDCDEIISDLSDSLANKKKTILILIDGPPGVTNKNARFPALPILLNHLSKHRLIIVMDDYKRDDEKETFELWESLAEKRYLSHSSKVIETEKGLSILTIN